MTAGYDARRRAEERYVYDGATQAETAAEVGVSERTVNGWAAEDGWTEKRREYREAEREIARYTRLSRLKLIRGVYDALSGDEEAGPGGVPQAVHAFAALERTAHSGPGGPTETSAPTREIRTPEDAVGALHEAVSIKLNRMLADPGALNFAAIRDLKKAMELVGEIEAATTAGTDDDKARGLNIEQATYWREQVLGVR